MNNKNGLYVPCHQTTNYGWDSGMIETDTRVGIFPIPEGHPPFTLVLSELELIDSPEHNYKSRWAWVAHNGKGEVAGELIEGEPPAEPPAELVEEFRNPKESWFYESPESCDTSLYLF